MTFGQAKRRLLGWLALIAPIPLPFNEEDLKALEWPILALYGLAVLYFLIQVERGRQRWLPNWALNLLGLAYFPLFALDILWSVESGRLSGFVRALLHLTMFVVVVKLFSIRREKDKWHLVIALFFLFVGAMATSSHLTVMLYLMAFTWIAFWVLARFAFFHLLTRLGANDVRLPHFPLAVGFLAMVLVAVPIFALLPRLNEPFLLGKGQMGPGSLIRTTGFSDTVDLNLTTRIRGNRDVALRIRYKGERPGEIRLRAATYERYEARQWHRHEAAATVMWDRERQFELHDEPPIGEAEIYLEPLASRSLPLPVEALRFSVELPLGWVDLDSGGAAMLPRPPASPLVYRIRYGEEPIVADHLEYEPFPLNPEGRTPRIDALALELMGEGEPLERARRLESRLMSDYAYTLDFVGRQGERPLDEFLFEHRSGHCELFATAMVVMLRSQGIPARLATGFLGGERNPLEGYFVVRQSNAHAWVEAFIEGVGWQVFDPTPPEGRPLDEQSWSRMLAQIWDFALFRWDRYVLSYGAGDQTGFIERTKLRWTAWWERFKARWQGEEPEDVFPQALPEATPVETQGRSPVSLLWLLVLAGAALLAFYFWPRPPRSASEAYLRLRRRLEKAGMELPETLAPLALAEAAAGRFPAAAAATRRVVGFYLRESFGGQSLSRAERLGAGEALAEAGRALRQASRVS